MKKIFLVHKRTAEMGKVIIGIYDTLEGASIAQSNEIEYFSFIEEVEINSVINLSL
jgi:hypothetical protein